MYILIFIISSTGYLSYFNILGMQSDALRATFSAFDVDRDRSADGEVFGDEKRDEAKDIRNGNNRGGEANVRYLDKKGHHC
jgi:hypothetical protein